jgi:hypothetical protein
VGHYDAAESLLAAPLEPPLSEARDRELRDALAAERARGRRAVERALEQCELRARRAGGALTFDRDGILDLAELDLVEAREEIAAVEAEVGVIEDDASRRYLARLASQSLPPTNRARLEACVERRRWDAAERLLQGTSGLPVAAPAPVDVPEPPDVDAYGGPLRLAGDLLRDGQRLRARFGWREPDEAAVHLLELLVSRRPSPVDVLAALDHMLVTGSTPSVRGSGSPERVVLTSTETLHVPAPRFVGPQGLELVLPGGVAGDDDVLLDVGTIETVGGPRLGIRELVRVALADGDRRVALLRVLGRQQRAEVVVSDLARVSNVDWALDWAFDFAAPRVAAPRVDVLLAVTGGHPRLTERSSRRSCRRPGRGRGG